MRNRLRIYDTQFAHGVALGSGDLKIAPDEFDWTRQDDATWRDIAVVSESCFHMLPNVREPRKVGLIIEPQSIEPSPYQMARDISFTRHFDLILTHSQSLIDTAPHKFAFYPFMGCWIERSDRAVYGKTRGVSIICSDKRITPNHRMRHDAIDRYRRQMDVFGRGYSPVPYKLQALRDYRFQVVIENETSRHWFTEKLIDCLVTGTIPLYCGDDGIGEFYNADGIMRFSTVDELGELLRACTEEEYIRRLPAVLDNFERAKAHGSLPDNYIFDKIQGLLRIIK